MVLNPISNNIDALIEIIHSSDLGCIIQTIIRSNIHGCVVYSFTKSAEYKQLLYLICMDVLSIYLT